MQIHNQRWVLFLLCVFVSLGLVAIASNRPSSVSAGRSAASLSNGIYLPMILVPQLTRSQQTPRRVNVPYFDTVTWGKAAIFWFGRVTPTENYADVRIGYTATELYLFANVFDRRIWYSTSPLTADLTNWDAVSVYLRQGGNSGGTPDATSYRFVAQFSNGEDRSSGKFQASYTGKTGNWVLDAVPFTTQSVYRGYGGPNQNADNNGWYVMFHIPFSSLGLSGPPAQGTEWGLGVTLHDRDDAAGTPIPVKTWPESLDPNRPATWGQLSFGLPASYSAPHATPRSTVRIRNGLNGAVVPDGQVGGWTTCGEGLETWTQLVNTSYAGQKEINVQNQWDVADWRCFAKYYLSFPLDSLPTGKVIISSTLTMYQFGNSGQGWTPGPYPSLIQVLTVNENWDDGTLTWNNAPLAAENVSQAFVDPLDYVPAWPGLPRTWDVSSAVASAYAARRPFRMVLYSADSPMHSGKYFYSAQADPESRPALDILWGDP